MIAKEFTSIDEEVFEITPGLVGFQFIKMRSPNIAYAGYLKCDHKLFAQYHNGNAVIFDGVSNRKWDALQLGTDSHNLLFLEAITVELPEVGNEMIPCTDTHERITKISVFKMLYHYDLMKAEYTAMLNLHTQNLVD